MLRAGHAIVAGEAHVLVCFIHVLDFELFERKMLLALLFNLLPLCDGDGLHSLLLCHELVLHVLYSPDVLLYPGVGLSVELQLAVRLLGDLRHMVERDLRKPGPVDSAEVAELIVLHAVESTGFL